ncbi:hypothetical protein RB653_007664 [Dictyostelium firmibasis]|uniref:Transmembrane protein 144 homolog n=1 Tax=Dictyostelium firmibasis TaxID=79012 RepID=A0AAN7TWW0_9MYCE
MVNPMIIGYIGSAAAIIGFGSNYVPVKKYPVGNGLSYAFVLSIGGLCVAFIAMMIHGTFVFSPVGILGGSLWAMANLLIIPIIKLIGLGLGVLLWSSIGIVIGFFSGKFGWLGLDKQIVTHDWMNWTGFAGIVISIFCFFFIKPSLEDDKPKIDISNSGKGYFPEIEENEEFPILRGSLNGDNPIIINRFKDSQESTETIFDKIPTKFKTISGISMSIICGILLGVNMIPMQLWKQSHPEASPFDIIFSQFAGVFLFNAFIFMLYAMIKKSPQIYPKTIFPSFVSGVMWGIANCGLMVSTQNLGYTVGYPISCSGPMIISSLWSVFYFHEIKGIKNLLILCGSFLFLISGIILLAFSSF